ncbi:preprotein translocase subunit SecE [Peptacetobacter sp.]|uniref:preprotein translocase subunit SecE n=1 Tax=Peptacetobacter sp. TaxID=2991975 RepID=UPI002ED3F8A4
MAEENKSVEKKERTGLFCYFKETNTELKRVTWPTRKELFRNTGVVLTVVIFSTLAIWGIDTLLSGALTLLLK